jgi:hypothetical protein
MYHTTETVIPLPAAGANARNAVHTGVVFELSVPGTSSRGPREALLRAFGESVRATVVAVDRQRDCVRLRVEVAGRGLASVIGALTANLTAATLGRARTVVLRR